MEITVIFTVPQTWLLVGQGQMPNITKFVLKMIPKMKRNAFQMLNGIEELGNHNENYLITLYMERWSFAEWVIRRDLCVPCSKISSRSTLRSALSDLHQEEDSELPSRPATFFSLNWNIFIDKNIFPVSY